MSYWTCSFITILLIAPVWIIKLVDGLKFLIRWCTQSPPITGSRQRASTLAKLYIFHRCLRIGCHKIKTLSLIELGQSSKKEWAHTHFLIVLYHFPFNTIHMRSTPIFLNLSLDISSHKASKSTHFFYPIKFLLRTNLWLYYQGRKY